MLLKADEHLSDIAYTSHLFNGIVDGVVFQIKKMGQFLLVQFTDSFLDILIEDKIQELLLFFGIVSEDSGAVGLYPLFPADGNMCKSDIGQHIVQITLLGIDHASDLCKLAPAITPFRKTFNEPFAGIWTAPQPSQFVFVFEKFGQVTEQSLNKLSC